MVWFCGMIVKGGSEEKRIYKYAFATTLGAFAYVVLYLTKNFVERYFVLHIPFDAVWLSTGLMVALKICTLFNYILMIFDMMYDTMGSR